MKLTFALSNWDSLIVTCLGRFGHVHPPDAAAATSVTDPLAWPILSADNPDLFNVFNIKILDALEVFREIFSFLAELFTATF